MGDALLRASLDAANATIAALGEQVRALTAALSSQRDDVVERDAVIDAMRRELASMRGASDGTQRPVLAASSSSSSSPPPTASPSASGVIAVHRSSPPSAPASAPVSQPPHQQHMRPVGAAPSSTLSASSPQQSRSARFASMGAAVSGVVAVQSPSAPFSAGSAFDATRALSESRLDDEVVRATANGAGDTSALMMPHHVHHTRQPPPPLGFRDGSGQFSRSPGEAGASSLARSSLSLQDTSVSLGEPQRQPQWFQQPPPASPTPSHQARLRQRTPFGSSASLDASIIVPALGSEVADPAWDVARYVSTHVLALEAMAEHEGEAMCTHMVASGKYVVGALTWRAGARAPGSSGGAEDDSDGASADGRAVASGQDAGGPPSTAAVHVWTRHTLEPLGYVRSAVTGRTIGNSTSLAAPVTSLLAVSGGRVFAGFADGCVGLIDLEALCVVGVLVGHEEHTRVLSLCLVEQQRLLSGGDDGTVRIYDLNTGQCVRTVELPCGSVNSMLELSSRAVCVGLDNGQLVELCLETLRILHSVDAHAGAVRAIVRHAFMPPGPVTVTRPTTCIASCGDDGVVRVWQTAPWELERELAGGRAPGAGAGPADIDAGAEGAAEGSAATPMLFVASAGTLPPVGASSPGGEAELAVYESPPRLVACSATGELCLWDVALTSCTHVLTGHTGAALGVVELSLGRLLSHSADGTLRVWQRVTLECVGQVPNAHRLAIRTLACSAGGEILVTGSDDGSIRLWDAERVQLRAELLGHTSAVHSLLFVHELSDDSVASTGPGAVAPTPTPGSLQQERRGVLHPRWLYSASHDQTVRVWDLASLLCVQVLHGPRRGLRCLATSADCLRVHAGCQDGSVWTWQRRSALDGRVEGRAQITAVGDSGSSVMALCTLRDGRLVVGTTDGRVRVYDARMRNSTMLTTSLRGLGGWGKAGSVRALATDDAETVVVSACDDGVHVYPLRGVGAERIAPLRRGAHCVCVVGDKILAGTDSALIRAWSLSSLQPLCSLAGHMGAVTGLAVVARAVVSVSADRSVRVWA